MTRYQSVALGFASFGVLTAAAPYLNIGEVVAGHESIRGHVLPGLGAILGALILTLRPLSRHSRVVVSSLIVGVCGGWVLLVHRQYLTTMIERRHFDIVFLAVVPAAVATIAAIVLFLVPRIALSEEGRPAPDPEPATQDGRPALRRLQL